MPQKATKEVVADEPRKSSFIPSDGKWSLMPPPEADGKASLMPSDEPIVMKGDGKYSLMPGEAKPSLMPDEAKPSLMPGDAKYSMMPGDAKPSLMPEEGEAKPSLMPGEIRPTLLPEEAKPSLMPGEAKPSIMPEEAKPSLMPEEAKPSMKPVETKPSLLPGEIDPCVEPKPSIKPETPEEDKDKPEEAKPSLTSGDAKPSLTSGEGKSSLTPDDPAKLSLESDEPKHCCIQLAMSYIPKTRPADEDEESEGEDQEDQVKQPRHPSSDAHKMFKKSMKLESMIPRNKEAWLDYLVGIVRKKIDIVYLNEKELRKVVSRARPNLGPKKPEIVFDPDAPLCLSWTVEEMADWIEAVGFPYLKDAFIVNQISGRQLILVDASALNQMGMKDLEEIRKVTAKIRDLLKIPVPNILRALMRIPPFERFLQKKVRLDAVTDALTFEQFCAQNGFIYSLLKGNKNAQIPCTAEVRILPVGVMDDDDDNLDDFGEDVSLLNAPSVEYVVRNMAVRDATVAYIIELLLENVFLPNHLRQYGRLSDTWKCGLVNAMEKMCPDERLCFACDVAKGLMEELEHTAEVLSDINLLQKYISDEIKPDHLAWLQSCAAEFMENVVPIANLMALGELDLENIFKQDPEVNQIVDGIVYDANVKLQEMGYDSLPEVGVEDFVEDYQNDNNQRQWEQYQEPQPQPQDGQNEIIDEFDELFK